MDTNGKLTREKQKSVNKIGHGALQRARYALLDLTVAMHIALHELDPLFRKVTLENERLRALVRDLKFHKDPVGMRGYNTRSFRCSVLLTLYF